MASRGLDDEALRSENARLVYARISPFGDEGPWADFEGSDLVHLALGGVMMNTGYDPDPSGKYETPPIAPQMWHAYHVTGEMTVMAVVAALTYRLRTGLGQVVSTAVHEAVAKSTEHDLPDWLYLGQQQYRQTCRHSARASALSDSPPFGLARTKDGRWVLPWLQTGVKGFPDVFDGTVRLLKKYGLEADLEDPRYAEPDYRRRPEVAMHFRNVVEMLVGRLTYAERHDLWLEAQREGMPWAAVRRPEESIDDEHWRARETFAEVTHPELGETFTYVGAKWYTPGIPWPAGPRPPLLGEHNAVVAAQWSSPSLVPRASSATRADEALSARGKPFALTGVRVIDMTWMLASAGAGRFLAGLGADVVKVEHESRWDGMRFTTIGGLPRGGRAARDAATEPLAPERTDSPNRSGMFMELNAGKRAMSLDLKSERGKEVLTELIRGADMVVEGFSPGTMDRMGFGYERLKEINPNIVYVQQSGMGQQGTYGGLRSFGPTAQALVGLSDMSGLPEPWQPAGIGYSFLDWFGAYNMANAMIAALYRQRATGRGCWIDASQGETGTYLTGTAVLDYSVNGRPWARYGNRSPYKAAAPHGAYPTSGHDRWIAIGCFTESHWEALAEVLGLSAARADGRFATLASRLEHLDEVDALVGEAARTWDGYELMEKLQIAGVAAGVCQNARDRYERDPQLKHLEWTVELEQRDMGRWPVREHPARLSLTPSYIGGRYDRSGPNYNQDTDDVLEEFLGYDAEHIGRLRAEKVIS